MARDGHPTATAGLIERREALNTPLGTTSHALKIAGPSMRHVETQDGDRVGVPPCDPIRSASRESAGMPLNLFHHGSSVNKELMHALGTISKHGLHVSQARQNEFVLRSARNIAQPGNVQADLNSGMIPLAQPASRAPNRIDMQDRNYRSPGSIDDGVGTSRMTDVIRERESAQTG